MEFKFPFFSLSLSLFAMSWSGKESIDMYSNALTEQIPATVKTKFGVNENQNKFSNKQSGELPDSTA
jgi:hypothetical protein